MKNRKMILERLLIRRLTDLSSCWKGTPLPFHLPMCPWAKHSVSKWVSDLWHTVWTAVSEPQCVNGTLGSPFLSLIIVKKRNALLYCVGKEQHNSYTELKKKNSWSHLNLRKFIQFFLCSCRYKNSSAQRAPGSLCSSHTSWPLTGRLGL